MGDMGRSDAVGTYLFSVETGSNVDLELVHVLQSSSHIQLQIATKVRDHVGL